MARWWGATDDSAMSAEETDRLRTPPNERLPFSMSEALFEIGEAVVDRDRTDPKPAIVINRPP
jgi:hypothetical protein